uniref:Single-stranded DNA binding protein Ssb-like OB fold domain-containing protein n=1 Tax=Vitis vinifera TaxID=29760 RepID=F6HDX5_VITVI
MATTATETGMEMAMTTATTETAKAAVTEKRKPVFTKVDQLKPGTGGHTLTVKVVSSKTVLQKGRSVSQHLRHTCIAECLVGMRLGRSSSLLVMMKVIVASLPNQKKKF